MKIFFDTEFACLTRRDPVSIGLVAEAGASFYREVTPLPVCHPWTQENVLPLLNATPAQEGTAEQIVRDLNRWLEALAASSTTPSVIFYDHEFDLEVLVKLGYQFQQVARFERLPESVESSLPYREAAHDYLKGKTQHHALVDAFAMHAGYKAYEKRQAETFEFLGL